MFFNDEDFNIHIDDVVLNTNSPGFIDIPPRDICAVGFRVEGEAEFKIDNNTFTSHAGDVIYMPQNTAYSVNYSGGKILAIHFTWKNAYPYAENYTVSDNEILYKLFLKARNAWENKALGNKHYVKSIFYDILSRLSQQITQKEMPKHFRRAVEIINNSFTDSNLSISEICKAAGIGQTSLRENFKEFYGKTPVNYITELRIENAKNLINNGAAISEAAYKSGFSDSKYFSRVVKQKYGHTPKELKKDII